MQPTWKRVPLWFKLGYTAFCVVLIPIYMQDYGPTNFLYFCDVALLMTLVALWTENALLISASAVGILLPQLIWAIDFVAAAVGIQITGMTAYMFSDKLPLFTRGLSFFHFWLPFVLAWLVWMVGYDRRAFKVWTGLAWVLLLVCFFFMPPPPPLADNPNLPVNINYVYGMDDKAAQTWMHPLAWLGLLLVGLPVLVFYPTHYLLRRFAPQAR
jgi:hypothetical protein